MTALEAVFWIALVWSPYIVLRGRRFTLLCAQEERETAAFDELLACCVHDDTDAHRVWKAEAQRAREIRTAPITRWSP